METEDPMSKDLLDLCNEQLQLEKECYDRGIQRYDEQNIGKALGERKNARMIFDDVVAKVSREIQNVQISLRFSRTVHWHRWFQKLNPDKTAWRVVYELLNRISVNLVEGETRCNMSRTIGKRILDQVMYDETLQLLKDTSTQEAQNLREYLIKGVRRIPRESTKKKAVERAQREYKKYEGEQPQKDVDEHIGDVLTDMVIDKGKGWFVKSSMYTYIKARRKKDLKITLSERAIEALGVREEDLRCSIPYYYPMVVPPVPWTRTEDNKIKGGYYVLNMNLVHGKKGNKHTAKNVIEISDLDIEATNLIQDVEWKINIQILDVMKMKLSLQHEDAGMWSDVDREYREAFIPKELFKSASEEDKKAMNRRVKQAAEIRSKKRGNKIVLLSCIELADKFKKYERFYFPHKCDFRLRRYPISSFLTPQGGDFAQALLLFANKKPLGKNGLYWLSIHVANKAGYDKISFEDRIEWVKKNEEAIYEAADDPIENNWWAQTTESPFCLLAACIEYTKAKRSSNVEEYECNLPITLDATCSGIQHLSAMSRDPVTAFMSNCLPSNERQDIYEFIRYEVQKVIAERFKEGEEGAVYWTTQKQITRQTVKRAVMTLGYGVTLYGVKEQLLRDGLTEYGRMANYLGMIIWQTFGHGKLKCLLETMKFFRDTAKELANKGYPLRWKVPTGSILTQAYYKMKSRQIHTVITSYNLDVRTRKQEEDESLGFSSKQVTAAAPNVVHSYDAAHLALTVLALHDEGITDVMCVHDSYGTHACDMTRMGVVLRDIFAKIYTEEMLKEFQDYLREYSESADIPVLPPLGTFSVNEVREAKYFFS